MIYANYECMSLNFPFSFDEDIEDHDETPVDQSFYGIQISDDVDLIAIEFYPFICSTYQLKCPIIPPFFFYNNKYEDDYYYYFNDRLVLVEITDDVESIYDCYE